MVKARAGLFADLGLATVLMATGAIAALYLHGLWHGGIPELNAYFGADTDRVIENLVDDRSDYYRATVHPLMPFADAWFQIVTLAYQLGPKEGFRLLAAVNGAAFAGLNFMAMRRLGVARLLAAAASLFACSTAAFVYWAAVPETHLLAGLCTLLALPLLAKPPEGTVDGLMRSALGFLLTFGIVVTDAILWGMAQIPFAPLTKGRIGLFLRQSVPAASRAGLALLAGVGMVVLFQAMTFFLLGNLTVGRLFLFLGESDYVNSLVHGPLAAFNALGLLGSNTPGASLLNLFGVLVVAACALRLRPEQLFIPAFVLAGMVLHLLYDPAESTLFAPNYLPAAVCAGALALNGWRPRLAAGCILVAAAALLAANLGGYRAEIARLAPLTWPQELYWTVPLERTALVRAHEAAVIAEEDAAGP